MKPRCEVEEYDLDYRAWTKEEMDLRAAETADHLAGDGLDEPDDE